MAEEVIRDVPLRYPVRSLGRLSEFVGRVSWGAIWAGAIIALAMEALFTAFGFFIGFHMYDAAAANPWGDVRGWSIFWYLVTAGWSMFLGAWCAARLSGNPLRGSGILHGITTWGLASFASLMLATAAAWGITRAGIFLLASGGAPPATAMVNPQATAAAVSRTFLTIWIGSLVGLCTAILGGLVGRPGGVVTTTEELPGGGRLAA